MKHHRNIHCCIILYYNFQNRLFLCKIIVEKIFISVLIHERLNFCFVFYLENVMQGSSNNFPKKYYFWFLKLINNSLKFLSLLTI